MEEGVRHEAADIQWGRGLHLRSTFFNESTLDILDTVTVSKVPLVVILDTKVEYLLDSIKSNDNTIQATLALIRSNPTLRANFEQAASNLIEVDPFKEN